MAMSKCHKELEVRFTYIQTTNCSKGRVVRAPVGHDVTLESELSLEDLVEGAVVLARPRRVELV